MTPDGGSSRTALRVVLSAEVREQLVLDHLPLVRQVAARYVCRLPTTVDRGELESAGVIGLIDAAQRFDPTRGLQFNTFAQHRIVGAMIDEMRSQAVLSLNHLHQIRAGTRPRVFRVSDAVLQRHQAPEQDAVRAGDPIFARRALTLLRALPVREAQVLIWHYWHGRTLRECGGRLGVGQARASQLHERALARLRLLLRDEVSPS